MRRGASGDPPADPFRERRRPRFSDEYALLGARFTFETDSAPLRRLVRAAYGQLPPQRLSGTGPRARVRLALAAEARGVPPPIEPLAGAGLACGVGAGSSLAVVSVAQRAALIVVPPRMLRHAYNVRYELLEFAVYTLAARMQDLVPLHAACMGRGGRGLLLLGGSGAGKSTLTLHCLRQGWAFLAEDSVLIAPRSLRASGIASFVHVRADSLRFLDEGTAREVRRAPRIRRRSGVVKYELDLRRGGWRLARAPLTLVATVLLSGAAPAARARLQALPRTQLAAQLARLQRYAASQPGWDSFLKRMLRRPAYRLHRGAHPLEAVRLLEPLIRRRPR